MDNEDLCDNMVRKWRPIRSKCTKTVPHGPGSGLKKGNGPMCQSGVAFRVVMRKNVLYLARDGSKWAPRCQDIRSQGTPKFH